MIVKTTAQIDIRRNKLKYYLLLPRETVVQKAERETFDFLLHGQHFVFPVSCFLFCNKCKAFGIVLNS